MDPEAAGPRASLHRGAFARLANRALRADAFVVGRRIFLSRAADFEISRGSERGARILAHELTHVRQYAELGIARFLWTYAGDYVRARLSGASHAAAYGAIGLEREAELAARSAGGAAPRGSV